MGEAEKNAARVFDADKTYFVLGGTSAANQIIFGACAERGDDVIIDRNCHKSIYHALISSGANPLYISPLRNKMGMAGPITSESIARVLSARASTGAASEDFNNYKFKLRRRVYKRFALRTKSSRRKPAF